MSKVDPYTLVARCLKESPESRASLCVITDLDRMMVDAAIHRFEIMGSVTKFQKGGEDHWRWNPNHELPTPQPHDPNPKPARKCRTCNQSNNDDDSEICTRCQSLKKVVQQTAAVALSSQKELAVTTNFNLTAEVRAIVDSFEIGDKISTDTVYARLLASEPADVKKQPASVLRNRISLALGNLKRDAILELVEKGSGQTGPSIYRKRDPKTVAKVSARREGIQPVSPNGGNKITSNQAPTHEPLKPTQPQELQSNNGDNDRETHVERLGSILPRVDVSYLQIIEHLKGERDEISNLIELLERRLTKEESRAICRHL